MAVGCLDVDIRLHGCYLLQYGFLGVANVLTGTCTLVDDYSVAWQTKVNF